MIELTPDLGHRLRALAAARQCSAEALAAEVLNGYLLHVEELTAAVREAEEEADRDGWVPHEEVVARFNRHLARSA